MTSEPTTQRALEGVNVLDFTHLLQGPFATQLLGDMGANIIKIERAGSGDMFRSMTFFAKWVGGSESPNFLAWNRNKRSIALNLKSPKVHALIMDMAKTADVASQNVRPPRSAGIQAPSGTRTPDVVPFQGKTTSFSKSTEPRSGSSP